MKKKTKLYLRLNLISIFFVAVSFISLTLAWFVYSGLSTVKTEVNVKAWYIELEKDGKPVTNDIVISFDDIYPGMETIEEEIRIKNLGDSDAQVNYSIVSARILDAPEHNFVIGETVTSEYVEDKIAHDYPFHINVDLSKRYVTAKTDETVFKVSISWPLDSKMEETDNETGMTADELDSYWGTEAYKFKINEQSKKDADETYQIQAAIRLDMTLNAEQYIGLDDSSDMRYRLGNEILYDVSLNTICTEEVGTCIRTNVIDVNNKISDGTVTLLPKVSNYYEPVKFELINTSLTQQVLGWNVVTRVLTIEDVLKVVSKDIKDSVLVRPGVSDLVIGSLKDENRIGKVVTNATTGDGYFKFLNKFSYFYSDTCYWLSTKYNETSTFAVAPLDDSSLKIYSESNDSSCKVIPVIIAEKTNLKV